MPEDDQPKEPSLKDTVAVSVACVALTGFGVLILALLFQLDLKEVNWLRAAFLLNGVEAIAFAAAGYLFGREVNRGRAEAAEDHAKSEAKRAAETETRGRALAKAVTRVAGSSSARMTNADTDDDGDPQRSLARLATDLFPPRGFEEWR